MVDWPDPGTPVRLTVKTWSGLAEHTGLALPPAGPKLVTMKLANGYNISFPHSYVESVTELDDAPDFEEETEPEVEQDESLPLVHLIHTGGTIASKVDYRTGAVSARFTPNELLDAVPELRGIARIRAVNLGSMWSDDIRPDTGIVCYRLPARRSLRVRLESSSPMVPTLYTSPLQRCPTDGRAEEEGPREE